MSIKTEAALRALKNEQQDNIKRLNSVIEESSRRYHQADDLKVSLKVLIAAIEILKEEQKKAVDTQIKLSQNMKEYVKEVVEVINAKSVESTLDNAINNIKRKIYNLEKACDEKINTIKAINLFLNGKFLRVLITISVFIGGIGGIVYFFQLVNEMFKNIFKHY